MDIFDQYGRGPLDRGTTAPLADGNPDAGRLALKRSQHQFSRTQDIEPCPIEVFETVHDQRRGICQIGDRIRLAGQQRVERFSELNVPFGRIF